MKFRSAAAYAAAALSSFAALPVLAQPAATHVYTLNNTLADANGGPALGFAGPGGNATLGGAGVTFESGQGLSLDSSAFASSNVYSIALDFSFSSWSVDGYDRVLNTNGADSGLYVQGTVVPPTLNYYEGMNHAGGVFDLNVMHHLVFARDDAGISIYVDGASAVDTNAFLSSVLGSNPVLFFLDNTIESGGGYVDSICTYDVKLSARDAETLGGGSCAANRDLVPPQRGAVPEPASWLMLVAGFGFLGAVMRRGRPLHRLAASRA